MNDETETPLARNEAAPRLGSMATWTLGSYLVALGPVMVYLLMTLWPHPYAVSSDRAQLPIAPMSLFGFSFEITYEIRLLALVALGGAMGSYLRSVISFSSFAETGNMPKSTWMWWCILQTYIGMLLACIFYFIMRGTTLPIDTPVEKINPFTTLGIAACVGLFTQQATDKLATFFGSVSLGRGTARRRAAKSRNSG